MAPAWRRARVVSNPRPEAPPVTMASVRERQIPETTFMAVLAAPKPESMGVCCELARRAGTGAP